MNTPIKCTYCDNMTYCAVYLKIVEMAGLLNNNMRLNPINENGFTVVIDTVAHDCLRFKKIED